MSIKTVAVLIPAYNPPADFPHLIEKLLEQSFAAIVVVNDGSSACHQELFNRISSHDRVTLLQHSVNLGKGAALKTGLNHCYCRMPELTGVVTADADGQHLLEDVIAIATTLVGHPADLIMGVRDLQGTQVPWRSRLGNRLTRYLLRTIAGVRLADTQTGLRGIPSAFIPDFLKIPSCGYEFELEMLLACKSKGLIFRQVPISAIYKDNNRTSKFNPLLDSMKIYYVLFRFSLTSISTSGIDYLIFVLVLSYGGGLLGAQVLARLIAMNYNYFVVKKWVFASPDAHGKTYPKYAALVFASGSISYILIKMITTVGILSPTGAKPLAEIALFLANFSIQKVFVFPERSKEKTTDWDRYFEKPYKISNVTRQISRHLICRLIREFAHTPPRRITIGEMGGGGSIFFGRIWDEFEPGEYHVYDNNKLGIEKLRKHAGELNGVFFHLEDICQLDRKHDLDLVFSVGLIEHFSVEDTKRAIAAHFNILRPGGIAILSFPTPTILYRLVRWIAEMTGFWVFHDERALQRNEVVAVIEEYGEIIHEMVNWPIFLTQMVLVVKKK